MIIRKRKSWQLCISSVHGSIYRSIWFNRCSKCWKKWKKMVPPSYGDDFWHHYFDKVINQNFNHLMGKVVLLLTCSNDWLSSEFINKLIWKKNKCFSSHNLQKQIFIQKCWHKFRGSWGLAIFIYHFYRVFITIFAINFYNMCQRDIYYESFCLGNSGKNKI